MALDPRFPALHLDCRGPEHQVLIGHGGGLVVDLQLRCHAYVEGKHREAAPRETFVQHGGQEAAVDYALVAAQICPDMGDLHVALSVPLGPAEWRNGHLPRPTKGAAGQIVPAPRRRYLHVRPGLGKLRVHPQGRRQWVRVDVVFEGLRVVILRRKGLEGFGIAGWRQDCRRRFVGWCRGHDEAE